MRGAVTVRALAVALVGVWATNVAAQAPALVSPSGTLPVTAALRSTAVTLDVTLAEPAVLLPLGYHAERGWYLLVSSAERSARTAGKQTVRFPRRMGALDVPGGTTSGSVPDVPDAGLGCAAARGVLNPATGHCGTGGSESVGPVLDVALGPSDYRGALIRIAPGLPAAELDAALRATRGERPAEGLARLAAALTARDSSAAWALVRVPRAP